MRPTDAQLVAIAKITNDIVQTANITVSNHSDFENFPRGELASLLRHATEGMLGTWIDALPEPSLLPTTH